MRRLFAAELPASGGVVALGDAARRHARVLRLAPGDAIALFDGRGLEAKGRVVRADDQAIVCEVGAPEQAPLAGPPVVLIQALPKGAKLDGIVRMATELGVSAIHLAVARRSVSRPGEDRAASRVERLERVAREAARQAGRADVPAIVAPAPLAEVAARAPDAAWKVVLWEGAREPLGSPGDRAEAWVVVGPEGGLAEDEIDALGRLGFLAGRLAGPILRVETAGPVAVALARERLGGFG